MLLISTGVPFPNVASCQLERVENVGVLAAVVHRERWAVVLLGDRPAREDVRDERVQAGELRAIVVAAEPAVGVGGFDRPDGVRCAVVVDSAAESRSRQVQRARGRAGFRIVLRGVPGGPAVLLDRFPGVVVGPAVVGAREVALGDEIGHARVV